MATDLLAACVRLALPLSLRRYTHTSNSMGKQQRKRAKKKVIYLKYTMKRIKISTSKFVRLTTKRNTLNDLIFFSKTGTRISTSNEQHTQQSFTFPLSLCVVWFAFFSVLESFVLCTHTEFNGWCWFRSDLTFGVHLFGLASTILNTNCASCPSSEHRKKYT